MRQIEFTKSAISRYKCQELACLVGLLIDEAVKVQDDVNKKLIDDVKNSLSGLMDALSNTSTVAITNSIHECKKLMISNRLCIKMAACGFVMRSDKAVAEAALKVKELSELYPLRKTTSIYHFLTVVQEYKEHLKDLGVETLKLIGVDEYVDALDSLYNKVIALYDQRTAYRVSVKGVLTSSVSAVIESLCRLFTYVNGIAVVDEERYAVFIDTVNDYFAQTNYLVRPHNHTVKDSEPEDAETEFNEIEDRESDDIEEDDIEEDNQYQLMPQQVHLVTENVDFSEDKNSE